MPFDPNKLKTANEKVLADKGVPPGKDETQPTIGEQINAARQKEISDRIKFQASADGSSVITPAARGLKAGIMRTGVSPDATGVERGMEKVGRYGPMMLGSIAAGSMTGGAGMIPSALGQFAGTGLGEMTGQGLAKVTGGNGPATMGSALDAGIKTGLGAAVADLGLGAASKIISEAPEIAGVFLKTPSESIKWAMKRMQQGVDIIPTGGPAAQLAVERRGTQALSDLQDAMGAERKHVGTQVDDALTNLHEKTQGKALFDVSPLAKSVRGMMQNELQMADPTVKTLVGTDNSKILKVLKTMETSPMKTARQMITIRRELDKLNDFSMQGVPKIESDAGQRVYKEMAHQFREVIDGAGSVLNDGRLSIANQNAHKFYQAYDELKPILGTRDQGSMALLARLKTLEGHFNSGGLAQDTLSKIGDAVPAGKKHAENLLDSIAARSFTKHALGTPSGVMKDLVRVMLDPGTIGSIIKAQQSAPARMLGKAAPYAGQAVKGIAAGVMQPNPESELPQ